MISLAEVQQLHKQADTLRRLTRRAAPPPPPSRHADPEALLAAIRAGTKAPAERVVTKIVKVPVYLPQKPDPSSRATLTLEPTAPAAEPREIERPARMERTVERTTGGLVQRVVSSNGNVVEVIRDQHETATHYVRRTAKGQVIRATIRRDRDGFITEITERVTGG